jgi:hypothetical protein
VGQTIVFCGLPAQPCSIAEGRVEKATGITATTERLVRFFMKFRRPAAVGDRRQKTIVCPTCFISWALRSS